MIVVSDPAHHIESEAAIDIDDIIIGASAVHNYGRFKKVEEKARRLFQSLESLRHIKREDLNNMMDIDPPEYTGAASMYSQIQAAVNSYRGLVLSIYDGMTSIEHEMIAQINRAKSLPVSRRIHLSAVAINMSVVSKLYLVQASFLSVNSNIDATLRLVTNDVNAYIEAFAPRITARSEVSDAALSDRVLKNRLLTEQYSELILNQRIRNIGAPIDIATLPAIAAAAALDDAVALETMVHHPMKSKR